MHAALCFEPRALLRTLAVRWSISWTSRVHLLAQLLSLMPLHPLRSRSDQGYVEAPLSTPWSVQARGCVASAAPHVKRG